MDLMEYRPKSMLVTKTTRVEKPRFTVFDAHNHLGYFGGQAIQHFTIQELCRLLDEAGVSHYVDLDGGWGENILQQHLDYTSPFDDRFHIFGGIAWEKWPELGPAFPDYAARRLEEQKKWGAQGLKIWKPFGLNVKDEQGNLVKVDDQRLNPIWEQAANLDLPVVIHVADPVAFFDSIDETNERWEEINANPDWAFTSPPYPSFISILEGLAQLVKNHPKTIFIGAHVGCYSENLSWVANLLATCPNFYVDISGRIGELGRQPYSSRRFLIQYSDRVLFGLDSGPDLEAYRISYRFLETDDEYFNYSTSQIPSQGRWFIYGLSLPEDVLQKIYFQNASKLILRKD